MERTPTILMGRIVIGQFRCKASVLMAPLATVLLALTLAGCGTSSQPAASTAPQAQPAATEAVAGTVPSPTIVPTAIPTAVPTPEPTPVPSPTAPPHPLSIAALRFREYPGSDLEVEQTLAPGVNYDRYIVSYRSDGLKIYALLTVPRGVRPPTGWPAIVFNHGYIPPAQYRTTERYIAYTDAFSRNGYVLLRPDYRGHGSSEGEARGGYGNTDYVDDVLNATASLRRWRDVDPNRIGMWGHSMGGYITLRSMVVDPGIKAGVIWAGVVGSYPDLLYNWGRLPTAAAPPASTQSRSWRNQMVAQYGTPDENPGFWASISANTYVQDLSGPIQLHHGTNDYSVPVQMSLTLDRQIREAGGAVELFVYPGDDHDISGNLFTALNRSVAFFDAHVKAR